MERLRQARSIDSVSRAAPLYATFNLWRCPPYPPDDQAVARDDERPEPGPLRRWILGDRLPRPLRRRELLVIGVSLENNPFRGPIRRAVEEARPRLQQPRCVLLDELSNLDFGWPLVGRFDGWEMGRTAVRVVGGFPCSGASRPTASRSVATSISPRLCERPTTERVQFGFLKLRDRDPRAVEAACRALREALPPDVVPYSTCRDPAARVRALGPTDGDWQAVRLRRAGRDDRGVRGDLPGPLQRRRATTWPNTRHSRRWATPTPTWPASSSSRH